MSRAGLLCVVGAWVLVGGFVYTISHHPVVIGHLLGGLWVAIFTWVCYAAGKDIFDADHQ